MLLRGLQRPTHDGSGRSRRLHTALNRSDVCVALGWPPGLVGRLVSIGCDESPRMIPKRQWRHDSREATARRKVMDQEPVPSRHRSFRRAPLISCAPQSTPRVTVLDGGLATELEARGLDLRHRLWSAHVLLTDPTAIEDVHLAYFRAGADVATTASYQASIEGFAAAGLDRSTALGLIRLSVDLAARARDRYRAESGDDRPLLLAGSVGLRRVKSTARIPRRLRLRPDAPPGSHRAPDRRPSRPRGTPLAFETIPRP